MCTGARKTCWFDSHITGHIEASSLRNEATDRETNPASRIKENIKCKTFKDKYDTECTGCQLNF